MDNIVSILSDNGVVIMPCDTIYGLVGIYPNTEDMLRDIKGREDTKPFLILIQKERINRFTKIEIDKYFIDLWPGPLTLIVSGIKNETIALRVPDDKRLQNILSQLNQPLFSTSVNRSGHSSLFMADDIAKEFGAEVDLFVNEGDLKGSRPSTIVDLTKKPYKLVRLGACTIDSNMLK